MFEITTDQYWLGIWYVEVVDPIGTTIGNIVFGVYRDKDAPVWHVQARFRRYADDKTFGSDDHKTSYDMRVGVPHTSESMLVFVRTEVIPSAIEGVRKIYGGVTEPDELLLQCAGNETTEKIIAANKSWMHVRVIQDTPANPLNPENN